MQNESIAKHTQYSKATQNEVWIIELCSPLHLHCIPSSSDLWLKEWDKKKSFSKELSSEAGVRPVAFPPYPLMGVVRYMK